MKDFLKKLVGPAFAVAMTILVLAVATDGAWASAAALSTDGKQLVVTGGINKNAFKIFDEQPYYRVVDTENSLSPANQCIRGKNQHQVLCPRSGVQLLSASAAGGNDIVEAHVAITSIIWGGNGNDTLKSDGPAWLLGDSANDKLYGSPFRDVLIGGMGLDQLDGGFGADILIGHGVDGFDAPWDFVKYESRSANVRVTLDGQANDGQGCPQACEGDFVASDIEEIVGGKGNDVLIGDTNSNYLFGGPGNDALDGGLGPDVFSGGSGTDAVLYWTRTAPVKVTAEGFLANGCDLLPFEGCENPAGSNDGEAGEHDQVAGNVETVIGGSGDDWLEGDDGANTLVGLGGSDTLLGKGGRDTIYANDGTIDEKIGCGAGTDTAFLDPGDPWQGCELRF